MAVTPDLQGYDQTRSGDVTVSRTPIEGCLVVDCPVREDERGWFRESWRYSPIEKAFGGSFIPRQGNHSRSHAGVLRGFREEAWHKLVYVVRGHALVVVADIRPTSPTFRRTLRFEIGDAPGLRRRIFIARGLANALFCYTETDYLNEVSEEFVAEGRLGVAWDDPDLGVDWPTRTPILSPTDRSQPTLRQRGLIRD